MGQRCTCVIVSLVAGTSGQILWSASDLSVRQRSTLGCSDDLLGYTQQCEVILIFAFLAQRQFRYWPSGTLFSKMPRTWLQSYSSPSL